MGLLPMTGIPSPDEKRATQFHTCAPNGCRCFQRFSFCISVVRSTHEDSLKQDPPKCRYTIAGYRSISLNTFS
jgi:hypothetical protein